MGEKRGMRGAEEGSGVDNEEWRGEGMRRMVEEKRSGEEWRGEEKGNKLHHCVVGDV